MADPAETVRLAVAVRTGQLDANTLPKEKRYEVLSMLRNLSDRDIVRVATAGARKREHAWGGGRPTR